MEKSSFSEAGTITMPNLLVFTSQGFPEVLSNLRFLSQDHIGILVSRKMQVILSIKEVANKEKRKTKQLP